MKKYFLVFPTYCYLKPNGDSVIQSFGVILHPYGSRRQKQPRQKNNDKSFFQWKQAMISLQGMANNGLVLSILFCKLMKGQFFYFLIL